MTIVLTDGTDDVQRYQFTLGEKVDVTDSISELYDLISKKPEEKIIIIGPNIKLDTARSIGVHFRLERPEISVILIRKRIEVGILTEALRAGLREVISSEDAAALVAACKRSLSVSQQISEISKHEGPNTTQGKILIVFSAKGGCGKTTTAINLAYALSSDVKAKVVLLDFDLQFGDVAIALQIDPKKTISDAISMQNNIDELGIQSLLINQEKNLDILLAPTNPTDIEFISAKLAENLIDKLRQSYDYIVVDSPPAFTDVILQVFDMADRCFLLTTLDMPAIKNLRLVKNTLEALSIPKSKLEYVLNKSDLRAGLDIAEAEEMIGAPFSVQIPSSVEVSISTNKGVPIVLDSPLNPVSKAFIFLARSTDRRFRRNKTVEEPKSFLRRNR